LSKNEKMKREEILQILMDEPSIEVTISEIVKKIKIPSKTGYRQVHNLIKEKILSSIKIGPYHQVKLNLNQEIALAELVKVEMNKKERFLDVQTTLIKKAFQKLEERLNKFAQIEIILVFGSYAKGKQKTSSDIDLIVLLTKKDQKLRQQVENLIAEISYEFADLIINPLIISLNDYFKMLQEKKENVGKQSFKNHIIIKGSYEFWKDVGEVIQNRTRR